MNFCLQKSIEGVVLTIPLGLWLLEILSQNRIGEC
jgi:hypothetical protein